jgi:hypothetical protein
MLLLKQTNLRSRKSPEEENNHSKYTYSRVTTVNTWVIVFLETSITILNK